MLLFYSFYCSILGKKIAFFFFLFSFIKNENKIVFIIFLKTHAK